jgi:hypothetical protein
VATEPRRVAGPRRRKAEAPSLYEGDTIEFGITGEIKHPKHGNFWAKTGGTTTIRPGETAEQAKQRLAAFCISFLDQTVQDIIT